jgi:hypothetical protein
MEHAPVSALVESSNPFCLKGDVGATEVECDNMSWIDDDSEGWLVKWLPRRPFGMKLSATGRATSASMDSDICRIPVGLKVSTWASAIVGVSAKSRVAYLDETTWSRLAALPTQSAVILLFPIAIVTQKTCFFLLTTTIKHQITSDSRTPCPGKTGKFCY